MLTQTNGIILAAAQQSPAHEAVIAELAEHFPKQNSPAAPGTKKTKKKSEAIVRFLLHVIHRMPQRFSSDPGQKIVSRNFRHGIATVRRSTANVRNDYTIRQTVKCAVGG